MSTKYPREATTTRKRVRRSVKACRMMIGGEGTRKTLRSQQDPRRCMTSHCRADLRAMIARLFPLFLLSCGATHAPAPGASKLPYDLGKPMSVLTLPDLLMEISALTDVDSNTVACVQDEAATMYE